MKKLLLAGCLALLLVGAVVTVAPARDGNGNGKKSVTAELEGFQEVPSISTNGRGRDQAQDQRQLDQVRAEVPRVRACR